MRRWASSFSRLIFSIRLCSTSDFWAEKISRTRFSMSSRRAELPTRFSAWALMDPPSHLDGGRRDLAFPVEMLDQDQDAGGDAVLELDPHLVDAVLDHAVPADVGPDLDDLFRLGEIERHAQRGPDLEKPVGHDAGAAKGDVLGQGVDKARVGR